MRWNVEFIDPKTGKERIAQLEAPTAEDARRQAEAKGVKVTDVFQSTIKTEAEKRDEALTAAAEENRFRAEPVIRRVTPEYKEIVSGAQLMSLFGGICFVVGMVMIIGGGLSIFAAAADRAPMEFLGFGILSVGYGIVLLVTSVFLRMNSSLALAVRDMARNSFAR